MNLRVIYPMDRNEHPLNNEGLEDNMVLKFISWIIAAVGKILSWTSVRVEQSFYEIYLICCFTCSCSRDDFNNARLWRGCLLCGQFIQLC